MASYWKQAWYMDILRSIFGLIDNIVYFLISILYQIFFNVANATLISGETIKAFYGRIQLILGILIMFKLAISLISGIMNPDTISDNKNGFFGIIKRIVIALVMLVLIVPLNIPTSDLGEDGGFNAQLNNNGILFGTLYEFQNIALSQNTLARLILGVSSGTTSGDIKRTSKEAGNELASIILKSFVTINVKSEDGDPNNPDDRMCQDTDSQESMIDYMDPTITTSGILNMINDNCKVKDNGGVSQIDEGSKYYVFNYSVLLSTVVGVFFVIILLGFIIDVAIRAFKLAILRLISPIPIISYVDPKAQQNGAFGAWVKAVTSTYIDLFLRLAIVYFILFIVQEFSVNGIIMDVGSGAVGLFSKIFILLGLFFFAKEAPGFIQSSLGIKSNGQGLFSGLGKILGAAGGVAGAYRGAVSGFQASRKASEVNYHNSPNEINKPWNRWVKPLASSVLGGLTGAGTALTTARDSKDHQFSRAMNRVNQMNASRMNYANDGSTWWGGVSTGARRAFTGLSNYDKLKVEEDDWKKRQEEYKGKKTLFSNIHSMAEDKAKTSRDTSGSTTFEMHDSFGNRLGSVTKNLNYNDFIARRTAAAHRGDQYFDVDGSGTFIDMKDAVDAAFERSLLDANTSNYIYNVDLGNFDDKGLKGVLNQVSGTAYDTVDPYTGAVQSRTFTISNPDDALKEVKMAKGAFISAENDASNKLGDIREKMPRAKANDERSKHDYK